jgi:hypothetical protein
LAAPRYQVEVDGNGVRVTVPAPRNWFVILFLGAWFFGWIFGEAFAGAELLHPQAKTPLAFLGFWLLAWTAGGAVALSTLLWQLAGREVLTVRSGLFVHRVEAFGMGRTRSFDATQVRRLRAAEWGNSIFTNQRSWFPPVAGAGYGPLVFDYGARTYRFAPSLDTAEAEMLAKELRQHLPRVTDEP